MLRSAENELPPDLLYQFKIVAAISAGSAGQQRDETLLMTECTSLEDAHPEVAQPGFLLLYKNVLLSLPGFPGVGRSKIESLVEDFVRRSCRYGEHRRTVGFVRASVRNGLDDRMSETEALAWRDEPRDPLSHCEACEPTHLTSYYWKMGAFEEIVALKELYFEGGLSCESEPQRFTARYLAASAKLGRMESLYPLHQANLARIRGNEYFLGKVGEHIFFLTALGELDEALELFLQHWPLVLGQSTPGEVLRFYENVLPLLYHRAFQTGSAPKSNVPEGVLNVPSGAELTPAAIGEKIEEIAWQLAEGFDARNGHTNRSRALRQSLAVAKEGGR